MDTPELEKLLAVSEANLERSAAHVLRQEKVMARLKSVGHDVTSAAKNLKQLNELHAMFLYDRNRLARRLSQHTVNNTSD